ncbi:MAG: hypothetical protein ACKOUM_06955 [Sphingopyxis sp.]
MAVFIALSAPTRAQEMLLNPSFEDPVVPGEGNNFYATIPHWTVTNLSPVVSAPFNVIRPGPSYPNNPAQTPPGGGIQYLDITSASGTIQQVVTLPTAGMISLGGWFSVRDGSHALTGLVVQVRNSGGAIIASASVSFTDAEPIGLWKHASVSAFPVAAGTYTFEAVIPDSANVDLVSLYFYPPLTITKSSSALVDPVNGASGPKMIPAGVAAYAITVTTPGAYTVSADTIAVTDLTPPALSLMVSDAGGGTGPIAFAAGGSALSVSYAGLGSQSDDIDFSSDGGVSWAYIPTPDGNGADAAVTNIRVRPRGAMPPSTSFSVTLRYRIH